MIKETLGVAVLGATLFGVPATAAAQTPGAFPSTAAAQENLSVAIRVRTDVVGNLSRIRVTLEDEDDNKVTGKNVCLRRRNAAGNFPILTCGLTGSDGRVRFDVNPNRVYQIRVPAGGGFNSFTSRAFDADENLDI
ncbi:hypothetical protein [Actinocorallia populi]|uniref:hypothetical protein n=1 Tax=Actinocorallia populi TaxID=2079200 RepID=UPI00130018C6|nr:hypothetical protein [Actinocorallia populi]